MSQFSDPTFADRLVGAASAVQDVQPDTGLGALLKGFLQGGAGTVQAQQQRAQLGLQARQQSANLAISLEKLKLARADVETRAQQVAVQGAINRQLLDGIGMPKGPQRDAFEAIAAHRKPNDFRADVVAGIRNDTNALQAAREQAAAAAKDNILADLNLAQAESRRLASTTLGDLIPEGTLDPNLRLLEKLGVDFLARPIATLTDKDEEAILERARQLLPDLSEQEASKVVAQVGRLRNQWRRDGARVARDRQWDTLRLVHRFGEGPGTSLDKADMVDGSPDGTEAILKGWLARNPGALDTNSIDKFHRDFDTFVRDPVKGLGYPDGVPADYLKMVIANGVPELQFLLEREAAADEDRPPDPAFERVIFPDGRFTTLQKAKAAAERAGLSLEQWLKRKQGTIEAAQ